MKPFSASALSRNDEPHFVPCRVTRWPGFNAKRCGMFCRHTWPLSSVMSNAFGTVSCSSVTVATISGGGGGDERCGKPVVSVDEPVTLADAEDVVAAAIGTGSVTGVTLGG